MFEFVLGVTGAIIGVKAYNKYELVRKQCTQINTKVFKKLSIFKELSPHIVSFEEHDKYAIRKLTFSGYEYKDLTDGGWVLINDYWFKDCLGSLEECQKDKDISTKLETRKDKGTPI